MFTKISDFQVSRGGALKPVQDIGHIIAKNGIEVILNIEIK